MTAPHYGSAPNDTSAPYPDFPTSIHNVDPAIANDVEGFGHSYDGEHHNVNHRAHAPNNHLDPGLHAQTSPVPTQYNHDAEHAEHDDVPMDQGQGLGVYTRRIEPPGPSEVAATFSPPGAFDMLPPIESTHPSWQALHEYAQSFASQHGYALSINTTAKNRSRIKLACVCYGAPKNTHKLTPETRVRKNRVSYKTGCKMWVEGKKLEDGRWVLRVGEGGHNHPGRKADGWAVQRKRTWGVQGGRVGVGGVTAKEEQQMQMQSPGGGGNNEDGAPVPSTSRDEREQHDVQPPNANLPRKGSHSLERGGLVWKIVEQEMLRKGGSGMGRDRGVGRTVQVLEERLPGIHIFKRDVYNIRAQIKRARKAAGQQIGEGLDESDDDEEEEEEEEAEENADPEQPQANSRSDSNAQNREYPDIDPALVAHEQEREPERQQSGSQDLEQERQQSLTQEHQRRQSLAQNHSTQNAQSSQFSALMSRTQEYIGPNSRNNRYPEMDSTLVAQCSDALKIVRRQASEIDVLKKENEALRLALAQRTKEVEEKVAEIMGLKVEVGLVNMALGAKGGNPMPQ